ncbi:MAG: hypothetical protein RL514_4388 [Verrucomicrobiota bacterium]|jgi:hypothetical protein
MNFPEPFTNMKRTDEAFSATQAPLVSAARQRLGLRRPSGAFLMGNDSSVACQRKSDRVVGFKSIEERRRGARTPRRWRDSLVRLAVAAFSVSLLIPSLRAATPTPPGQMAFQGFLSDTAGQPLGFANPLKTNLTFRIWRNATGTTAGDLVWSESQTVVVEQGQYTALLGNGAVVGTEPNTNHLATVFTGADASDRFLGVTVGTGTEIRPRIQFFASPFAQFSGASTMLVGAGGTSLLKASGTNLGVNLTNNPTVPLEINGSLKATNFVGSGAQLTGVSVSSVRLTGTITAAHIADGALTGAKLAAPLTTAELADGSVGSSAISANAVNTLAAQVGGVGSGAIVVSTNANNATLTALGFVNLGPATLDGETYTIKAFNGAPNAPAPRGTRHGMSGDGQFRMSAWTGSKWIIWGGINTANTGNFNDGAMFDPALGTWTPISSLNGPGARREFQTAWTGSKMILWGGITGAVVNDGKLYDPATDKWTSMSAAGAPSARTRHSGIWTGTEFIVWGGLVSSPGLNDGAIYNPATDTWRPMADSPLDNRFDHSAVWTGTEMIIQGGVGNGYYDDGARYNPATDTWTPMPFSPLGKACQHGAVWTGTEMIIFGGQDGGNIHGGARYNPVSNTWKSISPGYGTFGDRYRPLVAWTGHEMLIYGGGNFSTGLNDGVRYNPATDTWVTLGTGNNFIAAGANARLHDIFYTWTGSEFMWLGFWNDGGNNTVYSYRPPRPAYLYAKP